MRRIIACVLLATACSSGGTITKVGPPVTPAPQLTPAQVVSETFAYLPSYMWKAHTDAAEITIPLAQLDAATAERAGYAVRLTFDRLGFTEKDAFDILHTRLADGTRTATSACCEASWGYNGMNGNLAITIGSN